MRCSDETEMKKLKRVQKALLHRVRHKTHRTLEAMYTSLPASKITIQRDKSADSRIIKSNMSPSSYAQWIRSVFIRFANFASCFTREKTSKPLLTLSICSSPKKRSNVWKMCRWAISRWNEDTLSHERKWKRGICRAIRSHISGGARWYAGSLMKCICKNECKTAPMRDENTTNEVFSTKLLLYFTVTRI